MAEEKSEITVRCPHCNALCSHSGDVAKETIALCGQCHGVITKELKREFFRGISAAISARLVEKTNREFFEYLESRWRRRRKPGERGDPERNL